MRKLFIRVIILAGLAGCSEKKSGEPTVVIETEYGDITVALFADKAPKTVAAFLTNVDAGLYKGGSFYRVLKDDNGSSAYNQGVIQGGVFESKPGTTTKMIEHESPKQTGITHENGTISMARTTPGSASSEFFICIGDQRQFDSSSRGNSDGLGYAAFGRVVNGMDVVRNIQNVKSSGDRFLKAVTIDNIERD
ncbi:MAG: peptidylprolyl isomerase [Ferruginibacter sp.]